MNKVEHRYQVGEVVNESLEIVRQTRSYNGYKKTQKAYEVKSVIYTDAPTYIVSETALKRGSKCGYLTGRRVYAGNSLYSIESVRPYILDIEEAKTIAKGSDKKILCKCPGCGTSKRLAPYVLVKHGIMCTLCSKGTSYPELFMMAYLEVKSINYEYQKVFEDLPNRRFDFYLPELDSVIEMHGKQHYEKTTGYMSYTDTLMSDTEKKQFCTTSSIGYIEIDARESSFSYIKDSIDKSILPCVKEDKEIITAIENSKRYPIKSIINLYNKGESSVSIGKLYNVDHKTIINILNKCNYPTRDLITSRAKSVRCITTGKTFNSISEACRYMNLNNSVRGNISRVCKGKGKSAGKHPVTGESLYWEYVE